MSQETKVPKGMSPKGEGRNDKMSDVFEHIQKQFAFLADSVGMS
jgi:hypothetical protein